MSIETIEMLETGGTTEMLETGETIEIRDPPPLPGGGAPDRESNAMRKGEVEARATREGQDDLRAKAGDVLASNMIGGRIPSAGKAAIRIENAVDATSPKVKAMRSRRARPVAAPDGEEV